MIVIDFNAFPGHDITAVLPITFLKHITDICSLYITIILTHVDII